MNIEVDSKYYYKLQLDGNIVGRVKINKDTSHVYMLCGQSGDQTVIYGSVSKNEDVYKVVNYKAACNLIPFYADLHYVVNKEQDLKVLRALASLCGWTLGIKPREYLIEHLGFLERESFNKMLCFIKKVDHG